jgi:hypothetical protein
MANKFAGAQSTEAATNLVAHLLAKLLPTCRSVLLGDVEAIEHVEVFEDRVTIARHREDAKQFCRGARGTRDFPSADGVAAAARWKAAELRHVRGGQGFTNRVTEIVAELFEFGARHVD